MGGMLLCPPVPRTVTVHVSKPCGAGGQGAGQGRFGASPGLGAKESRLGTRLVDLGLAAGSPRHGTARHGVARTVRPSARRSSLSLAFSEVPTSAAGCASSGRSPSVCTTPPSSTISSSSTPRSRNRAAMAPAPAKNE
jgi:hypothetical protein